MRESVCYAHSNLHDQVCVGEFVIEGKSLSKGDSVCWRSLSTHGDVPCPRSDFAVSTLDGKIIVQGGRDVHGNVLDDIYALDPGTGMWTTMYRSDYQVLARTWTHFSGALRRAVTYLLSKARVLLASCAVCISFSRFLRRASTNM